jgi:hypothetical protein
MPRLTRIRAGGRGRAPPLACFTTGGPTIEPRCRRLTGALGRPFEDPLNVPNPAIQSKKTKTDEKRGIARAPATLRTRCAMPRHAPARQLTPRRLD